MKLCSPSLGYRVFSVSPRPRDATIQQYWRRMTDAIRWSETYGSTGVLIFVGNDSAMDPWTVAHSALASTKTFSPLIALNPVYMHPFTAAKMIASLTYLYRRRIYLNLVAGAALTHLKALNDHQDSCQRYRRLAEYVRLVMELLISRAPVSFDGEFYQVMNLQLPHGVPASLAPECLISGHSEAARSLCDSYGFTRVQMLQAPLDRGVDTNGIYFGLITRSEESIARAAAFDIFPTNDEGQRILDASMTNTDSSWKRNLREGSEDSSLTDSGYWLGPFRNNLSDAPYFVGSYAAAGGMIRRLLDRGVDTFILELPADEREYEHAAAAFQIAAGENVAGMMAARHSA